MAAVEALAAVLAWRDSRERSRIEPFPVDSEYDSEDHDDDDADAGDDDDIEDEDYQP